MAPDLFSVGHGLSKWSDVVLVSSDGKELHVHRLILGMHSQLFSDLLAAMEDRRLPLTDTSAELCALLGQWYPAPARVPLSHSNIELLLRLADKYQCNDLLAACRAFLTDRVLPELAACRDASAAAVRRKLRLVLETASIAQRCNLDGVAEAAAEVLGRHFFSWSVGREAARLGESADKALLLRILAHIAPPPADGAAGAVLPLPPLPRGRAARAAEQERDAPAAAGAGPFAIPIGNGAPGWPAGGGPAAFPAAALAMRQAWMAQRAAAMAQMAHMHAPVHIGGGFHAVQDLMP